MQRSIQYHRELIAAIAARDRTFAQEVMSVPLRIANNMVRQNRKDSKGGFWIGGRRADV
jgi:DNA-binding FadR family transcriptional regulator